MTTTGTNLQRFPRYREASGGIKTLKLSANRTNNDYSYLPPSGFSLATQTEYIMTIQTTNAGANNGFLYPSDFGIYRFWLLSEEGVNREIAYYDHIVNQLPYDSLATLLF